MLRLGQGEHSRTLRRKRDRKLPSLPHCLSAPPIVCVYSVRVILRRCHSLAFMYTCSVTHLVDFDTQRKTLAHQMSRGYCWTMVMGWIHSFRCTHPPMPHAVLAPRTLTPISLYLLRSLFQNQFGQFYHWFITSGVLQPILTIIFLYLPLLPLPLQLFPLLLPPPVFPCLPPSLIASSLLFISCFLCTL